ncbi:unnamed protein product [Arctogadus glacialis]
MRLERGWRASLALTLNVVAFSFAVLAVTTSYWCEGTRKVVKPFCTGPPLKVKQWFCIRFNSSNLNDSRLVQYIWETGEEKFLMRRFHTGIFFSCEQAADMNGFDCRDFSEIAPAHERGLCLWDVAHMMFTSTHHQRSSGRGHGPCKELETHVPGDYIWPMRNTGRCKQWFCIRFNSSTSRQRRCCQCVQYIWETGVEKFLMRRFHTGIVFYPASKPLT